MKKAIAIIISICIMAVGVIAVIGCGSIKCVAVGQGVYDDKYKFSGIYLFDEAVAYEGTVDETYLYAENGQKVSCGSQIAKGVTSNKAGMVYLGLDGYEGSFTIDNIDEITLENIQDVINVKTLKEGIKTIDNSSWYIYMLMDKDIAESIKKGASMKLIIGEKYYPVEIRQIYKKDEGTFALVQMKSDPSITDLRRGVTGYIIKSSYEGLFVPATAICQSEDKDGVYIDYNGYTAFRKVKVLYKGSETAVVAAEEGKGKLSKYDSVVKNASGIKSGMRIK